MWPVLYDGTMMRIYLNGVQLGPDKAQTGAIGASTDVLYIGDWALLNRSRGQSTTCASTIVPFAQEIWKLSTSGLSSEWKAIWLSRPPRSTPRLSRTLTIHNDGDAPLEVSSITYQWPPPDSGVFSNDWLGTVPAGGSTSIGVNFSPKSAVTYLARQRSIRTRLVARTCSPCPYRLRSAHAPVITPLSPPLTGGGRKFGDYYGH